MNLDFSVILANTQKAALDAQKATNAYSTIEISFTAPNGAKTTVTVKPDQLDSRAGTLPGPAELEPSSPEGELRHLFGENYGDGSLILLSKDDPDFKKKSAALKASNRRFDTSVGGWIQK